MPCFTGRAGHTLLRKDCPSGCACCVNSTYSCGSLKCNETLINVKPNDIKQDLCDIILPALENASLDTDNSFQEYVDLICALDLPSSECPVNVSFRFGNGEPIQLVTIQRGQCFNSVASTDPIGFDNGGEYTLLLDNYICGTFNIQPD